MLTCIHAHIQLGGNSDKTWRTSAALGLLLNGQPACLRLILSWSVCTVRGKRVCMRVCMSVCE